MGELDRDRMAGGLGQMMQSFSKMRQSLKTVCITGRAGNDLVVCTFNKDENLVTYMSDIKFHPNLIRDHPNKIAQLVKEAVNDGLKKEMDELAAAMPPEARANMDQLM